MSSAGVGEETRQQEERGGTSVASAIPSAEPLAPSPAYEKMSPALRLVLQPNYVRVHACET